ncbi:MAG TPA: response regulator transcription factor [Candidatus Saccharimonadales bacterium]|nr:response regulator transcription factor [Candidatus Saccharimonadales bacterium]
MNASPTSDVISVWLIEDHDDFRKMVAWQINQLAGMRCSRHFSNCEDALAALDEEKQPQVILCDIGLPGMDGIAGIRKIKIVSPQTHVIVLTVYDDHDKVFNAICAGASGYLLKNASEEGIASAVKEVLNGGAPVNPRVARLVLEAFARQQPASSGNDYGLSAREKDILELMVKGLIKKEIADKLGISFHTVNNQLRSIYEKLRVHTRGGAVAKALKERLF